MESKKWALVGPGAVGLYYGGRLAAAGAKLNVLARSDAAVLATKGIRIAMIDPKTGSPSEHINASVDQVFIQPEECSPADVVIVAAKTTVNADLVEALKALVVDEQTIIVCLQNGMGNAEFFSSYFSDNPILVGLCFVCVNRTQPGVVENYHPGKVEIGSLDDCWPKEAQFVADALNTAGVQTNCSAQLNAALWRKLCWNVPFNGLSIASGGITTDQILADSTLVARARALMEEIRAAADRDGIAISDTFLHGQFTVTERMGAYKPSSLIDFLDGRPVELESIWGEPLRRGEALGAKMPALRKLYSELKLYLQA